MRTGKGKETEHAIKELSTAIRLHKLPARFWLILEAYDEMTELLDEAEKFWNTPGWRERIGWEK